CARDDSGSCFDYW
nr:immunoglobulin heavy chain junction region [Macaca mulatta]MOV53368.1 immunoglobulin heavy chain junction region [Macaca mulatta]MOV53464.1 immunoglobulin heavy chain junction region [Macaca mulatta]MOV53576.1 immunoglobulin heavy chain junction region [Macaca mulatta]MOV53761.1 immunoglobulin heavy chain junction region [Macaca mulatta]